MLASSDESAPTLLSASTAQPIGRLHKRPPKPVVAVSPPASRAQPSKAIAQVKMGPPRGAIKARARPRKKRLLSVEEDAPVKKKPLFPPRFQLLSDPDMLAHPLMAQELDSLLPILQTSLVSALFQASFFFLYLRVPFRSPLCARTVSVVDKRFVRRKVKASSVRSASEADKATALSSSLLKTVTS